MDKRGRIEGSAASKLVQLMRQHGHNKDVTIELGEVLAPLPNLQIRIGTDEIDLDMDDLIVSQTAANGGLAVGDRVIIIGDDDSQLYFVIDKAV
ncbi:DUF2577 domain-containing protein [Peribacillus butanolivorans]|uniref:DUF2577 domain-containing protein n=1 Tax=Peribacillus butanolivorans TaxID=421767 RepID=UPI00207C4130|nr:DUF2577 domain-containing protein [Peribacillus butanolivorans]MCO0597367.1 DUF2577 domain-containing protein [Peribacillus butanolivorans]